MNMHKKPGSDQWDHDRKEDRSRPSDYSERSNDDKGFDVTNTRPAPPNPHREQDQERDRNQ